MTATSSSSPSPPPDTPREPGRFRLLGTVVRAIAMLACAALVALLVYGLVARSPDTTVDDSLANHQAPQAPAFTLAVLQRGHLGPKLAPATARALADGRLSLNELRGRRVVLNFWASWCIPCREEAPLLERTWRRARRDGVLFLGLDMQDVTEDARGFLRHFRIDYLNIRDPTNTVAHRYGVTGVPETFFITPTGRIVSHVIGVATAADLRDGIDATATGRPISARRAGAQGATR